jgi:hypothetical protein
LSDAVGNQIFLLIVEHTLRASSSIVMHDQQHEQAKSRPTDTPNQQRLKELKNLQKQEKRSYLFMLMIGLALVMLLFLILWLL